MSQVKISNMSHEMLLKLHNRIEHDLEYSKTKQATDVLVRRFMDEVDEEMNKSSVEYKWSDEDKIKWIKTLLSVIETSNEHGEDDGFKPIFNGPYKADYGNLDEQIVKFSQILKDTIVSISKLHDEFDEKVKRYRNILFSKKDILYNLLPFYIRKI
jgi:hypothetical protein